jgi:hypothetical protein
MSNRTHSTPEAITDATLSHGDKRSREYRAGLLDVLKLKLQGIRIECPYRAGTAEFDAYFSGNDRGFSVWRQLEKQGGAHHV